MGKGSQKTLTKAMYDAVGNHFRKLWGKEAGWAHSVLFTADLRTFSDRLVASKAEVSLDVQAKEGSVKVETNVTTTAAVKRPKEEDEAEMVPKHENQDEADVLIHVSRTTTTTTRRMSKRLRGK